MASTVAATGDDDTDRHPRSLDSVPVVDLSLLSQSDLYSLSQSSDSAFDLNRCDDVVIPKINRAVFNESAGSRKQTYSRLRLASAESSSTTTKTTTLHRRTPHLRASLTHPSNNINDPEQAENSQIIRMLKQLCKSDPNFHDVDQIEDENSHNYAVPEFLNPQNLGIKRKRGRPRKHENVVFLRPPTSRRLRNNTVKKIIVYDDERDKGIINDRGVAVNMATLAGLEDPYGSEIRRRTVGMLTEEELLGFLRGLNGQWGSRRRKRRVVDASEFGDALPKGWKLSLCIKKKEGRVWLFCRRYLSPSGRQFESCKEISTYLISVIGEENLNKAPVPISSSDDLALQKASVNDLDFVIQEDIKRDGPVDDPSLSSSTSPSPSPSPSPTLSPPAPAVPENCEVQVNLDAMEIDLESNVKTGHIGSHMNVEIQKIEPSVAPHAELDDPVLILAGKDVVAEADDTHSGMGNEQLNSCKESNADKLVHDLNVASHSKQDEHTNIDRNSFIEESCVKSDKNGIVFIDRNSFIEESCVKSDKNGIINDDVSRTDQAPDVAVSQSELLDDGDPSSIDEESNGVPTTSGEMRVNSVDNKSNFQLSSFPNEQTQVLDHDKVPETGVTFVDPAHNKSECIPIEQTGSGSSGGNVGDGDGDGEDIVGATTGIGVLDPAVPETGFMFLDSAHNKSECIPKEHTGSGDSNGEGGGGSEDIVGATSSIGMLDTAIPATGVMFVDSAYNKSECIPQEQMGSGCGDNGGGCEDIVGTAASIGMLNHAVSETTLLKTSSICEEKSFDPTMGMDISNISNELISEKEKVVGESSSSSGFFLGRFGLDKDGATVVKGIDSVKPVNSETVISFQKHESHGTYNNKNNNKNVNKLSSSLASSRLDGPFDIRTNAFDTYGSSGISGMSTFQEKSKTLGSDVSFSTMEEPMMQINSGKSEELKLDDFHIFRNDEAKRNESEDVMDFNAKSNLEFCSLVPSENEQAFEFQDLYDNSMEDCKEESSERGLLNHFSDDIFENKMYSTPLDGLKFDEDRDLNSNELSLAFGNPNVPSKIEEAFDVHTNLSMVNSSMMEDLKEGRGSVGGLFNLSGNVKTSSFQNSWGGIKSDEFKSSGNKFTSGFGSNQEVVPSGIWRTGDGNQLQGGLSIPSHSQIPSSSSFHSFNIMSEKAADGQFRVDERYNQGFGVSELRSNRPEPVEFSFLTSRSQHNPHSLQGDSRVFSYGAEMDQQFDSSFWLGKNTMMPNPPGRNQITGVCAWCRSEFHLPMVHSGAQDGIGSLCPTCARMSGHVNML